MSMSLTYARISDRTVADEYFSVTQQVEALYATAQTLPAKGAGPKVQIEPSPGVTTAAAAQNRMRLRAA